MDQELNRGLASTQLSRKDLLVRGATAAALVGATGLLAACGASTSGGTSAAASSSAGGSLGNVDFLSWAGYDLQPPMEAWRKANGVQLNTTYINTQEDVLTKLRSGGTADVSTYFTTFYGQMRDLNLLTELDPKRLPNFTPELIAPGLYDQPYWSEDGKLWGVPMEMQSLPCNYRTDKMSAPASWADLLDPKYKGRIVLIDDWTQAIPIAAKVVGLVDKIPNLTQSELAQCVDFLKQIRAQARTISSYGDAENQLASGDVWVTFVGYALITAGLRKKGIDVSHVWPKEGGMAGSDIFFIPTNAKNPDAAYAWINEAINYTPQKYMGDNLIAGPVNKEALWALKDVAAESFPHDDMAAFLALNPFYGGAPLKSDEFTTQSDWVKAWEEIKAS